MRLEELKFRQMVDQKLNEFCDKYDEYFGMKHDEGFHTTMDILLYLDNKPQDNRTAIEQKIVDELKEFRQLQDDYQQLIKLNKERAIEFNTRLSTERITQTSRLGSSETLG